MRLDKAQIEAMRRQVEEDFKLDMSAIDRLERRFMSATSSAPSTGASPVPVSNTKVIETIESLGPATPSVESRGQAVPDELTGSLRQMFSSYRK